MRTPVLLLRALQVSLSSVVLAAGTASASTFTVSNTNDSGVGSLREAITSANSNPGADTIWFLIGSGAKTISLFSALPHVTGPTLLDGWVQSGYSGMPLIRIDANADIHTGLRIESDSVSVRGLILTDFDTGLIVGSGNGISVRGCYFGTTGNSSGNGNQTGIRVFSGSNITLGGALAGDGNVISGNAGYGIYVDDGVTGLNLFGNRIGTNAAGTAALANGSTGLSTRADNVTIGGTSVALRNIVSGNAGGAIDVAAESSNVVIQGNHIGVDVTGAIAIGNDGGIGDYAVGTQIGGTAAGAGNVVSGNAYEGMYLAGSATQVFGNRVGTNAAGTAALGNASAGIRIAGGNISIGGATAVSGNLISGNGDDGISLDATASSVTIRSNRIGTNASGTAAIANAQDGLDLDGTNIVLGDAIAGNLISGNGKNGVTIGDGLGISLRRNIIGLDASGTFSVGNGQYGIRAMGAPGAIVGVAGSGNVISGNNRGFVLQYDAHDYSVQGNVIGLDATATNAVGNKEYGISILTANNQIGGTAAGSGNVIAANKLYGVLLREGSTGNHVEGNYIGTNAALAAGLGNWFGVVLHGAHGNFIGGTAPGAGNVIANNGNQGIYAWYGANNRFLRNRVFGNEGMGIDLEPQGPMPNDALDADHGANDGQNFPVLMLAQSQAGQLTISGRLASAAGANYRVEFFLSPTCDASGMGQGAQFLDALDVITDAAGKVSYAKAIANNANSGFVSATATTADGNTSEFSPCVAIGPASAGQFNVWRSPLVAYEDVKSMDVMVTRSVGLTGSASVTFTTMPQSATSPADYGHVATTLTFADGEAVKLVKVPLVFDTDIEGDEEFTVALSGSSAGAVLGAQAMPDVLLFDHDPQYPVYSVGDATAQEPINGQVMVQVPIHLSGGNHPVTISYETVDASASAGADYVATSGTVTFAVGETLKLINVAVLADDGDSGTEIFHLEISGGGGQDVIAYDSEGEIVIEAADTGVVFANGFE